MISNLSEHFAHKLLKNGTITEDELELYVYGLFMLLSQVVFTILICIFGLVFRCLIESIIFFVAFQFIRKYAGGYHAKTETRCTILSTLSLFSCVVVIKLSKSYDFLVPLLAITAITAIFIAIFCPLDTPEKPLTEKEHKYFKKISLIILAVICALIILSYIFKWKISLVPLCMSLVLEGVLIIAGKIKSVILNKKTN